MPVNVGGYRGTSPDTPLPRDQASDWCGILPCVTTERYQCGAFGPCCGKSARHEAVEH